MSDKQNYLIKHIRFNLMLLIIFSISAVSFNVAAGIYGNSQWQVEKGDSFYSIARQVFPDDKVKQRQFRKQLLSSNAKLLHGDANRLFVGQKLQLPAFAITQPVLTQKKGVTTPLVEAKSAPVVTPDPQDIIGHVVISVGDIEANNRGSVRKLLRHSALLKGDTISTSASTYTQMRMKDGALISLRPNTTLKITDYRFNGKEDGSERSFMELVKGGFRTITGYIGHKNKQNYHVRTAVATIGIRGTHYGLMLCEQGSCQNESASLEDGLYGGVVDGSISVENEAGQSIFNNDQYFHVASISQPAVEQLVPPPIFHGKAEARAAKRKNVNAQLKSKGQVKKDRLVDKKPADNIGSLVKSYIEDRRPTVIPQDQATNAIKDAPVSSASNLDAAPVGSGALISFLSIDSATGAKDAVSGDVLVGQANNSIALAANNTPVGFRENANVDDHRLILPSGVSGVTSTGGNALGVNWGRWSDTYVFTENGTELPTFGALHYIYSDNLTTPTELAALGGLTASESYTMVGGTIPTNAAGQNAKLLGLNVTADFVNQQITNYQIAAQDVATGNDFALQATSVPFGQMASFNLNGSNCTTGCTGSAGAAFVGKQAQGMMTTYSLQNTAGTSGVNGAAFLTRDSATAPVIPLQ